VEYGNRPSSVLMLHLLGRCNLECLHCYMEGSPHRQEQLSVEAVLRTIGECQALGIGTLFLTGGEPLLYRNLDQVLEAAAGVPGLQTTVCTNGTLLNAGQAARFREWGLRVNISIDGRPEFHDRFRNQAGSFCCSERGVHAAVQAGVPVTIITTISRANLDSLEFVVGWAAAAGATQFFAQPLLNLGRGTQIASECLTFAELNRLILQLTDLANQPRTQNLQCHVIGAKRKFLLQHPCGAYVCNGTGCHRGVDKEIKKIVIREDGTVLPEVPNLSHRYSLGKIQDGPLSELISRYFERGYNEFDRLCRAAYAEVLPAWDCIIVPWEQIIAERSQSWSPSEDCVTSVPECISCASSAYGAWKQPVNTAEQLTPAVSLSFAKRSSDVSAPVMS
jgi:MoaA/NifB/PqqE/SkfB family radical SAM enzyme